VPPEDFPPIKKLLGLSCDSGLAVGTGTGFFLTQAHKVIKLNYHQNPESGGKINQILG
jgi:hypothetical protein